MLCSTCNERIDSSDQVAHGRDGESHARCAKRATAHGEPVDILSLHEAVSSLKKRVQELEREVEGLDYRTASSMRVGGGA